MSQLDTELKLLRQRLAYLEQQKIVEIERELQKKAHALQLLENLISEKKERIEKNRYSRSVPIAAYYDSEKIAFLEPILNVLKDFQLRLEALESAKSTR
jgi:DNA-binding HxlR family transcriptional regulator